MKKVFAPLLTTGLAAFLASATISCNQGGNTASTVSTDSAATISQTEPIVYINADTLLENYEYFKEMRASLEAKAQKAQQDLQARSQAFQREIADYQQKAPTMSAADRQSTEERLARKQDELARHQQNASTSFAQDEAEENEKLFSRITEYLSEHAKEKGYKFVLTYSRSSPTVLYADDSLEITREVLDALNEAYRQDQKNK